MKKGEKVLLSYKALTKNEKSMQNEKNHTLVDKIKVGKFESLSFHDLQYHDCDKEAGKEVKTHI